MTEKSSKLKLTSARDTAATRTTNTRHSRWRMVQNLMLIWVDGSVDESQKDYQDALAQLRTVINDVKLFTQPDQCIQFLSTIDDVKVFVIVTGIVGVHLVPNIYTIPQLDAIYILCDNQSRYEQWAKEWIKVKGVYTDIKPICQSLQVAARRYNQDAITMSFVSVNEGTSNQNLDQLDSLFMYTQIFKEILLEMEYDRQSVEKFSTYCRNADCGSPGDIKEFENEYQSHSAIWWYSRLSFIYSTLNQGLRELETEAIINMGFFIRDLHAEIKQLHQEQFSSYHGQLFTVFRGQGLSKPDFDKLQKTNGGLMSFNTFLSTSRAREVSLIFAASASTTTDMVGVLFEMAINPLILSAPFADIQRVSYFPNEKEVLFSMNTVFRIGDIKKIDNNDQLYQVELKLTGDDDQQLRTLTQRIRDEVSGLGLDRLGTLLLKIGRFNKAEELYTMLLEQASNEKENASYNNQLGFIKDNQGEHEKAIWYYEKALEIQQKILPPDHSSLATSHNNIGLVYQNMGEYSKALFFYEKGLEMQQKADSSDDFEIAYFYNNIGSVYLNIAEYSKALSFYEKGLENLQKVLPPNHPLLATSYNNIGGVYDQMGEYLKALSFFEKALEIRQKTLPPSHASLASSYNNIGGVYDSMGEYLKALPFFEKAREIYEQLLPPNPPSLAISYGNIGAVYSSIGEYLKALPFFEKAIEIQHKTLPPNHPSLATSNDNIGLVYQNMGEYSKALSFYEKALEMRQETLPSNHPDFATSFNSFATVYYITKEYEKALLFYEKALEIRQKSLSPNHPSLASSYKKLGWTNTKLSKYLEALPHFERALDIKEHSFPPDHPSIQDAREDIEMVRKKL